MDDRLLHEILDELGGLERVTLNGLGEPLLDHRMPRVVRRFASAGILTQMTTNGLLLEKVAPALMDAGLGLLALSLDGATADTQRILRSGTDTARLLDAFGCLVRWRLQQGLATRLAVTTVLSVENLVELPDLVARVAAAGADDILLKNLCYHSVAGSKNATLVYTPPLSLEPVRQALAAAERVGIGMIVNDNVSGRHAVPWSCPYQPLSTIYISVEGLVFPCFFEGERWMDEGFQTGKGRVIGDLRDQSLASVLGSPSLGQFRAAFARSINAACLDCVVRNETYEMAANRRAD